MVILQRNWWSFHPLFQWLNSHLQAHRHLTYAISICMIWSVTQSETLNWLVQPSATNPDPLSRIFSTFICWNYFGNIFTFFICSSPYMSSITERLAACHSILVCCHIMLFNIGRGSPKLFTVWIHDRLICSYLWIIWVSESLWASVWYCTALLCASSSVVATVWGGVFWTVIKPLDWLVGTFPSPVPVNGAWGVVVVNT